MVIRVIELLNNFYKDAIETYGSEEALGDYCIWGFFDALNTRKITEGLEKQGIMQSVTNAVIYGYDGMCNRKQIVCIHEEEKKDEIFWENPHNEPYLYMTMIRKEYKKNQYSKIKEIMRAINERNNMIAYYSYSHSEVIVVGYASSCKECMKKILQIKELFPIFKTVTVFGIKEEELYRCSKVKKEKISLRLAGKVRNQKNAINMVKKIDVQIRQKGVGTDYRYNAYDTLGAKDIIIEIINVPIENILPLYSTGALLTHTNSEYGVSFYNIETQIIREFYSYQNHSCQERRKWIL